MVVVVARQLPTMDSISRPAGRLFYFVCSFSVVPFSVGGCRMVPTPGQLRGQPDNTPHRNGTDDRALGRALALAFPAGAIGLFILVASGRRAARPIKQSEPPMPR